VEPERSGDDAAGARRVSEANQPITEAPLLARCGESAGVIERAPPLYHHPGVGDIPNVLLVACTKRSVEELERPRRVPYRRTGKGLPVQQQRRQADN